MRRAIRREHLKFQCLLRIRNKLSILTNAARAIALDAALCDAPGRQWLEDRLMWFREGIRCAATRTHAARINDARTHDHE